jgi:hypothetical protein
MDKTKILILAANPWDTKRISPEEEYQAIKSVWQAAKQRDNFVLEYAPAASDAELRQALLNFEPDIVHFSGHGERDGLYFQQTDGNTQFISKEALTRLFALFAAQIKCVVLNACYSEEQANAIGHHINHVIGMNRAIGDNAAIKFATGFYQALFNGKDIEFAFEFGCSAIDLSNISEWQTPQLKKKQTLISQQTSPLPGFIPHYDYDVLIHATVNEKAWSEDFLFELKKYVTQKLANQPCTIHLATNNTEWDKAATTLLILSADSIRHHQTALPQLAQAIQQKRVFLAEYSALPRPEALRGLLSYCFWQADSQVGLYTLDKKQPNYFLLIENIATDIANRLKQLKSEQQVHHQFQQMRQHNAANAAIDALIFMNIAPEDSELSESIQNVLQDYGVGYALPALTQNISESRADLENKLLQCDAVLLIYEQGAPAWIDFQLLTCSRSLRKREEPFKIVAVYTEEHKSKFNVHLPNLNLQIFYCRPEEIQQYLPLFIEALA